MTLFVFCDVFPKTCNSIKLKIRYLYHHHYVCNTAEIIKTKVLVYAVFSLWIIVLNSKLIKQTFKLKKERKRAISLKTVFKTCLSMQSRLSINIVSFICMVITRMSYTQRCIMKFCCTVNCD